MMCKWKKKLTALIKDNLFCFYKTLKGYLHSLVTLVKLVPAQFELAKSSNQ